MIIRAAPQWPVEQALFWLDRQIVDAGKAPLHEALLVEFPILVAVTTEPQSGIVMPFISKAHGDAIVGKGP